MKKSIIIIIALLLIVIVGASSYYLLKGKNSQNSSLNGNGNQNRGSTIDDENNSSDSNDNKITNTTAGKILVVYYSAQKHTENIAKKIANNLGADIFEIEPTEEYTSEDLNWSNEKSRVSREHNDESKRNVELVTTKVENWESYDTVLIGYPIWWGIAAWPVNNFIKDNDFTGKTVITFCTSASSGLGNSAKLLEDLTKTGNWQDGYRFNSSATDTEIKKWTDSIK